MLDLLNSLDTQIFLIINGWHNSFFDVLMVYISARFFWIPFYLLLLYLLVRNYQWQTIPILLSIALMILLTDQGSVHLFKNVFQRLRPCHDPNLALIVHTVEKCGGQFGFLSSHAANSFGLAFFISSLLRKNINWIVWVMYLWAVLVIYSRVYLGVHFPGDVIAGAAFGTLVGWLVLLLYSYAVSRYLHQKPIK